MPCPEMIRLQLERPLDLGETFLCPLEPEQKVGPLHMQRFGRDPHLFQQWVKEGFKDGINRFIRPFRYGRTGHPDAHQRRGEKNPVLKAFRPGLDSRVDLRQRPQRLLAVVAGQAEIVMIGAEALIRFASPGAAQAVQQSRVGPGYRREITLRSQCLDTGIFLGAFGRRQFLVVDPQPRDRIPSPRLPGGIVGAWPARGAGKRQDRCQEQTKDLRMTSHEGKPP